MGSCCSSKQQIEITDNEENLFVASVINEKNIAKVSHHIAEMATTNG